MFEYPGLKDGVLTVATWKWMPPLPGSFTATGMKPVANVLLLELQSFKVFQVVFRCPEHINPCRNRNGGQRERL
jgi:hypothetical protein